MRLALKINYLWLMYAENINAGMNMTNNQQDILDPLPFAPAYDGIRRQMAKHEKMAPIREQLPFLSDLYRCAAHCVELRLELEDVLKRPDLSDEARKALTRTMMGLTAEWTNPVPSILTIAEGIETAVAHKVDVIDALITRHPHLQPLEVVGLIARGTPISDLFRSETVFAAGYDPDDKPVRVIDPDSKDITADIQKWRDDTHAIISTLMAKEGVKIHDVLRELHHLKAQSEDPVEKLKLGQAQTIAYQEAMQEGVISALAFANPYYVAPSKGHDKPTPEYSEKDREILDPYKDRVIDLYHGFSAALEGAHQTMAGMVKPAPSSDLFHPQPVAAINQLELDVAICTAIYTGHTGRDPNKETALDKVAVIRDDGLPGRP